MESAPVATPVLDKMIKPTAAPVEEVFHSEGLADLATALAKAQAEIRPAAKDAVNPHFKSKYADLAAVWEVVRGPITKNGLSIVQIPSAEAAKVTVTTMLLHTSGQWIRSRLTMIAAQNTPQGIGSCITYARRYALSAVLGVAAEIDDDGNAASAAQPRK